MPFGRRGVKAKCSMRKLVLASLRLLVGVLAVAVGYLRSPRIPYAVTK
jgi:hypothetical protein